MPGKTLQIIITATFLSGSLSASPLSVKPSFVESGQTEIKYSTPGLTDKSEQIMTQASDEITMSGGTEGEKPKIKSPTKAFFMSLAVPGLGQLYYGNKIKAAAFAAVEVTAWFMNIKYNNDGDDKTAAFEAFSHAHWSRESYEEYLGLAYSEWVDPNNIDDDDIEEPEISHHLPETNTQQYYEMTGKYDQFSWGWDDAVLDGLMLDDFNASSPPPDLDAAHPYSARRFQYETMRHDANVQFDRAKNMVVVAMANHLVSAFEAFLRTRHNNNKQPGNGDVFGSFNLNPGFKTVYSYSDTPFLKVSYKF